MTYNSQRDLLTMPEYGRNVQNLIDHAKTIEDDKERQEVMERIVELMLQMNPQSKNLMEYKEKLWRHAFRIADYDINVNTPSGAVPSPEEIHHNADRLEYPVELRQFRHYGKNVKTMIKKAISMEDQEKKDAYTLVIANYMKLAYQTWSTDHFINDKMVREDLATISEGQLSLSEDQSLNVITVSAPKPKKNYKSNNKGSRNNKGKSNYRSKHRR